MSKLQLETQTFSANSCQPLSVSKMVLNLLHSESDFGLQTIFRPLAPAIG
jgi:hypothetical protein